MDYPLDVKEGIDSVEYTAKEIDKLMSQLTNHSKVAVLPARGLRNTRRKDVATRWRKPSRCSESRVARKRCPRASSCISRAEEGGAEAEGDLQAGGRHSQGVLESNQRGLHPQAAGLQDGARRGVDEESLSWGAWRSRRRSRVSTN